MPDPEIKTPEVPWGPLIAAGVAATGASMLFPAAGLLGLALGGISAAVAIPVLAVAGAITGYYAYKGLAKSSSHPSTAILHAKPHCASCEHELSGDMQKEWSKSEALRRSADISPQR